MSHGDTGLFACPACDCLFVAPAGNGAACCPICRVSSSRSGREWLDARRTSAFAAPAVQDRPAALAEVSAIASPGSEFLDE